MSLRMLVVMGTRPEVIKLAPIVLGGKADPRFQTIVVTTSQHRQMLDQMLETFRITPDLDLDIMKHDQNLAQITAAAMEGLYPAIDRIGPDVVVVQGDTTTTLIGALAAFYHQLPVAHVEAGLRTYDKRQPFPEEINRRLTSQIADYHFAPTETSRKNLLHDGISDDRIWVTGNTCIDSLFITLGEKRKADKAKDGRRQMLLTAHRRENHGEPMERICKAVRTLVDKYDDLEVTYPVHLSPRVRKVVMPLLGEHDRIRLVEPMDYAPFVDAMAEADLILTDSGGVQEEAPALDKPVLVLRETTERPEGVDAGTLKLVGTDVDLIVSEASRLLDDSVSYASMAKAQNPYGDGTAGKQILDRLYTELSAPELKKNSA